MKIRYILLTSLVTILVVGGGLVYIGHDKSGKSVTGTTTPKKSHAISSTQNVRDSSSKVDTITASGTDYQISIANGLGGAFAKPVSLTKIINEKIALDIIASIPNLNNFRLKTIVANNDMWVAKINVQGNEYAIFLSHYTGTRGLISLTDSDNKKNQYVFKIPETLYAPYRSADKESQDAFSQSIAATAKSDNELTENEAVKLANKYVNDSESTNINRFKFKAKNGDSYNLMTDIKKGSNGSPDVATYATVQLTDNNNVHITAGVWTSTMSSHAPFYDKIVPR